MADYTVDSLPPDLLSGRDDGQTRLQGAGSWGAMELVPADALPR